jgi:hypothetical protein
MDACIVCGPKGQATENRVRCQLRTPSPNVDMHSPSSARSLEILPESTSIVFDIHRLRNRKESGRRQMKALSKRADLTHVQLTSSIQNIGYDALGSDLWQLTLRQVVLLH